MTGSSVQDCATLSVAEELDLEPEKCTMHQGDKIGKSAIGELVRSKNKVIVNPFPHGLNLLKMLRDQARHFSAVHTNRVKYDKFLEENPHLPGSSIQVDLNDTRMSSVHGLIRSSLRIKRTLTRYFATYDIPVYLNNEDWEFAREVEGVLNISKDLVTLSQNEKKINSVYGPLFKRTIHQGYLAEAIQLIDIESWGKTTRAPRSPKKINAFSIRGRECRKRAMLECERRFFGNTEETTFEDQGCSDDDIRVKMTKREFATLLLDPRTCVDPDVLDSDGWQEALTILEGFYVDYYVTMKAYDRKKVSETNACVDDGKRVLDEREQRDEPPKKRKISLGLHMANRSVASSERQTNHIIVSEESFKQLDKQAAKIEFKSAIAQWTEWDVPWSILYPNNKFETFNLYTELMDLNMKVLLDFATKYSESNDLCFGLLPLMCKVSKCQLGALMSQSFAERMNSRGKLIVTENRTCLKHSTLEKLVVLKMNKMFIKHCRQKKALQIIKMGEQNGM